MNMGKMRVLLDTNVWLDAFLPGNSRFGLARELLATLAEADVLLLYPAHVIADVFYKVRNEAKTWFRNARHELTETAARAARDHAWSCVMDMHAVATAVGVDEHDVEAAVAYRGLHEDLEDDLVLAAALRAHADYLVTSDAALLRKSPVAALAPADMLALLRAGG